MDTKAIRERAASAVGDIHAFAARAEILSCTVPDLCDEIDRLRTALTRTIATFSAIGSLDDFANTKSQRQQALAEASAALGDNWKP